MNPLVKAVAIAANAHLTHAPDKGGSPYILHPLRMMMKMTTDEEKMVAVLHDVVEDHASEGWTFERLATKAFPKPSLTACVVSPSCTKTRTTPRSSTGPPATPSPRPSNSLTSRTT